MRNMVNDLIDRYPDRQFSRADATPRAKSLFGNTNDFAVGMGMGNAFGTRPAMHNKEMHFGQTEWMKRRRGG